MASLTETVLTYLLAGIRFIPLFFFSSVLPFNRMPVNARMILVFFLSATVVAASTFSLPVGAIDLLPGYVVLELAIGVALSFSIHCALWSIQTVGRMLDMQIGFGAAGILNPKTQQNEPLLGSVLLMAVVVLILEHNWHHGLILALVASFEYIPPGSDRAFVSLSGMTGVLGQQFFLGLILVLPVILSLLVLDTMLGMMSKTMPQANIYFVALPLKIAVGLLLIALVSTKMYPVLLRMFETARDFNYQLLGLS